MNGAIAIARREVGGYFQSPVGWVVLTAFWVLNGFFFSSMIGLYNYQSLELAASPWTTQEININDYLVAPFFANTGVILLFLCPAITMRLLAEDRRSGAFELLLTSPVSTAGIVIGKYLGAMGFVSVMLAGTLPCMAMVWWLGDPDPGVVASGYLAALLLSGSFVAVGLLASSLTRNQVIALVVSFSMLLLFWILSWADISSGDGMGTVIASMSMLNHLENLTRGLLHLKDIVYYTSFIGFFLFATWQRVESERWA